MRTDCYLISSVFTLFLFIFTVLAVPVAALIQTDLVYTMDDTYVNSSSSGTNYDGQILYSGTDGGTTLEAWFRFDLTDPSGYYVLDATLWNYVISLTASDTYYLHPADSADWTETNLTHANKPGNGASLDSSAVTGTGWWSWSLGSDYGNKFVQGDSHAAYLIRIGTSSIMSLEDKEDSGSTGNVPYLNLTMMIPEVYLTSPPDSDTTYDTIINFQYNTTDVGNIVNCSLILDGAVNMTNTSAPENATSIFTPSEILPGNHNWTVRCYDVNRYSYQIEPAPRDFTISADVEWYDPSSATPLDIGSGVKGGSEPSGTRQVYANNTNTNVQVSCASGDCGVVTSNWSTTDLAGAQTLTAGFNCSTTVAGNYQADFQLTSDQDGTADTLTVSCTIQAPDIRINSTNITFSDDAPTENQEIDIMAGVYNDGDYDATSIVVRFYDGNYTTGSQIGGDHSIDLTAGSSTTVTQNWTTSVGTHEITVVVDPPIATGGAIDESDETNNYAYNTLEISMWTYFVGNVTGSLALQTEQNETILKWDVADTTDSIIYVTDTDSNIQFNSLKAFSRNTTGAYMSDDFLELDNAIGTTAYPDSINISFTSAGSPLDTTSFTIFGVTIDDVPVIDSTEFLTFRTGILWDASDDSNNNNQFDNTSNEDVIFVTKANQSQSGKYGDYDYEIRVPANLRNYKGPDTQTVTFYTEIK